MSDFHLAGALMVKNEQKNIVTTLNSLKGYIQSLVIYDTGSTDDTVKIIREYCAEHDILLRLKEGVFEDFAKSRNVLLDYCDTFDDIDYILLLDGCDELRNGEKLREILASELDKDIGLYLVVQEWHIKSEKRSINYKNPRLLRPRKGFRYEGSVHESIPVKTDKIHVIDPAVYIYQDRDEDIEKSKSRFKRDEEILLKEHHKNPEDTRTVYYLAQTYDSLKDNVNARIWHKKRYEMKNGFQEERYISAFRVASLTSEEDGMTKVMYYLRAYDICRRVAPVLNISVYYRAHNKHDLAYYYAKLCMDISYPEDALFYVSKEAYGLKREMNLAITCFNYRKMDEGWSIISKLIVMYPHVEDVVKVHKIYCNSLKLEKNEVS
jgi:glycosyltransferase involved in cell wall biosynthesis